MPETMNTDINVKMSEVVIASKMYKSVMIRNRNKIERTKSLINVDFSQYADIIAQRKMNLFAHKPESVFTESEDGLKLHGYWVPAADSRKTVICFHGYSSRGIIDFMGVSDYYIRNGYSMLLLDERAHGDSEGDFIGFGCLDRKDALKWIDWVTEKTGEDAEIILHGMSMGGATVLMAGGLELPSQVKGIISDCAFTSAEYILKAIFYAVHKIQNPMILAVMNQMNLAMAGYELDECNSAREVKNIKVPVLMIHGSADTFVPSAMCDEIAASCANLSEKVIIEGAGHMESYYKNTEQYEAALDRFLK